jgi:invasion protein IalB
MDNRVRVSDIAARRMAQIGLKYNFSGQRSSSVRMWAVRVAAALGAVLALVLLVSLWLPEAPDAQAQQNRQQQTIQVRPPAQQQQQQAPAAADQRPQPTVRNFDDWALICDKPQGAPRDICFVFQQITMNNSTQRLLLTRVGQAGPDGASTLNFTLPLGSRLASGMAMKVDDNTQIQAGFQVCLADGCQAVYPLDAGILQQMSNGKQAIVGLIDHGNGQQVNINMSLKGFAAAYKALPNAPPLARTPAAAPAAAPTAQQTPPPAAGRTPAATQPAAPAQRR